MTINKFDNSINLPEAQKRRAKGTTQMKNKLPCKECGARCCGPVPMTIEQFKSIPNKLQQGGYVKQLVPGHIIVTKDNGDCGYLTQQKTCSIYEIRPLICRIMGDKLPCPYLHPDKAHSNIAILESLVTLQKIKKAFK